MESVMPMRSWFREKDRGKKNMIQKFSSSGHVGEFRRKAEEIIRRNAATLPEISEALSPAGMLRLLHEMHVQQVELEIQNEELQLAREDAERMRKQADDLYELIPVGCFTLNHNGMIVNANLSTAMLLGIDRSSLIMEPLGRFIAPEFQDSYHLKKQATLNDVEPQTCRLQMIKGDGSLLWVRLDCRTGHDPEGNRILRCVLSDISEQRRSYEALNESVDFTKSLIQSMDSGFSVLDLDGVATDANPAMCEMTGFSKEELIGRSAPHPYWPPEEYPAIYAALEETMTGQNSDFELIFMRKNGERFPVTVSAFAVEDRNGKAMGFAAIVVDITERRMSEQILRESEQRYRQLHESMMDGFAMGDLEGRLTEWNDEFQKMVGYTDEQLAGMHYQDLTPAKWHLMEAAVLEEQVLPRGYSDCFEKEYVRADGKVFPVELRICLIRDDDGNPRAFWAIVRDISERKQNEQLLRNWNQSLERRVAERTADLYESDARFRLLVGASNEGIVISKDGIVLDGNPQFGKIYQCDTARLIGRPVSELIAPESRALVASRLASEDETTYEFIGLLEDGTRMPLEAHGRTMTWQGVERRVTNIRDLTAEKEAKARLEAQKAKLDKALRLAIISEVCAGIIHQIGQPLSAVGVNVAAASARLNAPDAQARESLETIRAIEDDVKRMRDLVNHLRALAHPDRPERKPVDFNAMVSAWLAAVRSDARSQHLEFNVKLASGLPSLQGDAVQLGQVVTNLVQNALEASAECPLERRVVGISTREIPGSGIELTVRDEGTGMNPGALNQLFSPFFSTKPGGMGIGLRLCLTIVEAHGGSIEGFNNPEGPGMTFRVLFPLDP